VLYLDTSALVKLAVAEPETPALTEALAHAAGDLFTSVIGGTELARALHARAASASGLDAERFAEHARRIAHPNGHVLQFRDFAVRLAPLTPAIAHRAGSLAPGRALRSLDALHLATGLAMGPTLDAVVTYDARMIDAARDLELPVASPGAEDSSGAHRER
jgi:predicted nucleic acid-binding protein